MKFRYILTHKLLPILSIFLLCITVFVTYSFGASSFSLTGIDGKDYIFTINDELSSFKYYAIFLNNRSSLYRMFTFVGSDYEFHYNNFGVILSDTDKLLYYYTSPMMPNHVPYSSVNEQFSSLTKDDLSFNYSIGGDSFYNRVVLFTNFDIKDEEGNVVNPKPSQNPYFITSKDELSGGKFDVLKIDAADFDTGSEDLILRISNVYDMGDGIMADYEYKLIPLDINSDYLTVSNLNVYYYIPQASLGIDISNGKSYRFDLCNRSKTVFYDSVVFTVSGLSNSEEIENSNDEQTDAIKENTETNKGIWETIKELLSYINPFSENFFVYKLLELLFEGIKALIIPSDGFFEQYFNELNDWFSDRLGFLYYPIELLIDILNRYLNLSSSNLSFTIPDIVEPFNNEVLIHSTTFDFNDILKNSVYKQVHDYYLIFVDFIIGFGLIKLAIKKWEEVTSK